MTGYVVDHRIDEPGEIALFGEVVDVYSADATRPVGMVVGSDGVISEILSYDPVSQRSKGEIAALFLGPASELILDETNAEVIRQPGIEHGMAATRTDCR